MLTRTESTRNAKIEANPFRAGRPLRECSNAACGWMCWFPATMTSGMPAELPGRRLRSVMMPPASRTMTIPAATSQRGGRVPRTRRSGQRQPTPGRWRLTRRDELPQRGLPRWRAVLRLEHVSQRQARHAGCNHRLAEVFPRRNPKPAVVHEGAVALFGDDDSFTGWV